ncbi:hypothetical protein LF1_54020 [Rubripirellula obstinata]|uniref:Uncharacterized protein n=1 Tax=Rubripirellula obstinata TaxID=406547 RepID=A0A5B1CCY7_9BACT|nr:hypothetical protein LF1_54020 [Rubripirellula obstinata]
MLARLTLATLLLLGATLANCDEPTQDRIKNRPSNATQIKTPTAIYQDDPVPNAVIEHRCKRTSGDMPYSIIRVGRIHSKLLDSLRFYSPLHDPFAK